MGDAQVAGELDLPLLRRRDHRLQEVLHALEDRLDGRAEPVVVDRRVVVEVTVEGGVGGVAAADALLRALVLQRGERVAAVGQARRRGEVVGWGQSVLRPRAVADVSLEAAQAGAAGDLDEPLELLDLDVALRVLAQNDRAAGEHVDHLEVDAVLGSLLAVGDHGLEGQRLGQACAQQRPLIS